MSLKIFYQAAAGLMIFTGGLSAIGVCGVTTSAPSGNETVKLILNRVEERKQELKRIDKILFFCNGDVTKMTLPEKTLQTFAVEQFKKFFLTSGIRYAPAMSPEEKAEFEKTPAEKLPMARGLMLFDLYFSLPQKGDYVAYYLKMSISDNDAAAEYLGPWDRPSVWQSEYIGSSAKTDFMADIKRNITNLMNRAAADFKKARPQAGLH